MSGARRWFRDPCLVCGAPSGHAGVKRPGLFDERECCPFSYPDADPVDDRMRLLRRAAWDLGFSVDVHWEDAESEFWLNDEAHSLLLRSAAKLENVGSELDASPAAASMLELAEEIRAFVKDWKVP